MDVNERKRRLRRIRYRRKRRRAVPNQPVSDSEPESGENSGEASSHDSSDDDDASSTAASVHDEAADEEVNIQNDVALEVVQNNELAPAEDHAHVDNNNDVIEDADHAGQAMIEEPDQNVRSEAESEEEQENHNNSSSESDFFDNSEDERQYPSEDSEGDDAVPGNSSEEDVGEEDYNSDEDRGENNGNQPIYPGAPITLHESLLAIFTVLSEEHLTGKLLGIILNLIALHCPANSILKKTLYAFKKYFANLGGSKIVYHYYCDNCIYPLKTKDTICPKCRIAGNVSFFLELPLLNQLQYLFRRQNFYDDLQYRFNPNRKQHQDNLEDIYDGQIYQEQMVNNGFLSVESNISFMWYSDGVQVFKSSSFSIWPLCLAINELPYKKRTQPENLLLVGLWFGRHKPSPNIYLKPLLKTMDKFSSDGHIFKLPNNLEVLVKGKILCGVCDLPAKCKFLLFKQFNGAYGCTYCLSPGGRVQTGKTTVQVYPYQAHVELRTHDETQLFARQALIARATDNKASVNGVKGPTLLSKLVPNIIRSTGIDIMHGIFLGLCRAQILLLFSSTYSTQPWSLHHLENTVDEKLRTIKPPSFVQRTPRLLKDIKLWKASEFKLFIMYYSIVVFKDIMEDAYFQHHCRLVSAISLLSQDSISHAQIESAKVLLLSYVNDYARLYSLRYLGINIHQIIHLPDVVRDLGPLWVFSCFFFENYNGKLNRLYHGTQHIALQVCSSVSMLMTVPVLTDGLNPDSEVYKFCKFITNSSKTFKLADQIDAKTFAVGTYSRDYQQLQNVRYVLRTTLNIVGGTCNIFHRLKKSGVIYVAKSYRVQSERRESSFVSLNNGTMQLGQILRFVRWSDCGPLCEIYCKDCPVLYFAIVKIYQRCVWFIHDMPGVRISYLSKVEKVINNVIAVNVNSLCSLCFYFQMNGSEYIATPINTLEVE